MGETIKRYPITFNSTCVNQHPAAGGYNFLYGNAGKE